jgi:multicomponent K+:H+ antiporter subunit C
MEALLAIAIGVLTAAGVYLMLRARTFPVLLGLTLLSYAVNLFLFASGRLVVASAPLTDKNFTSYPDPLPQALVLTAIVIGFGMTALLVVIALRALRDTGDDHVDGERHVRREDGPR